MSHHFTQQTAASRNQNNYYIVENEIHFTTASVWATTLIRFG
ncbi:hypothetical protein [Spirosoma flavum]|uniref:Uncharacterized protein n=1 Tax=Spirosoma flavum TaxID=2048557 RepID=A0ABW6AEQ2_9BACT